MKLIAAICQPNYVISRLLFAIAVAFFATTVAAQPTITTTGNISSSSTIYGTVSTAQVINVAGDNLTAGILVAAPAGFEISLDDITFNTSITIGAAGTVSPTQVFVRLSATTPVGSYQGSIVLSSTGAVSLNVPVTGTIIPILLVITANDQRKFLGDANPVLTVKYTGFVNNDGPAQLTTPPFISTTATISSPIGKYPIIASGATASNYQINYVPGVLEVVSGVIVVPNTFTPNGDGINDTWDIKNLNFYNNCTVTIFNRYGNKIFFATGYPNAWNGTYNDATLPVGAYYYIINLNNGTKPITGSLTIIR